VEDGIPMVVRGADGEEHQISAVIDTRFTGYLTLPSATVTVLGLEWLNLEDALLGDGSIHSFDAYRATVIWDADAREVEVNLTETGPLIGLWTSNSRGNFTLLNLVQGE
jgi:predicted aspartyl protease